MMQQTVERASGERVMIMGAAGRDFHNFNVVYRGHPRDRVISFTAAQIPDIAGRTYPASLAGPGYPNGIPILEERALLEVCERENITQVVFAYSDVSNAHVMHVAQQVLACGCDFVLLGPQSTMLGSDIPVIAISAVRTGCGKSQTARWLSSLLNMRGYRVAVLRHPMPYGDLAKQAVQRFASFDDLLRADCTIEEREEYEPHIACGNVVYAGVDYGAILAAAERDADIIIWDGGNNDFPFVRPDLHLVLVDPLRADHALTYYPSEAVLRMADVVVVAKTNVADAESIAAVSTVSKQTNARAKVIKGASPVALEHSDIIRGARVLVVEDGPTITHGGMSYGAGYVAARAAEAETIVDPRTFACGDIEQVYANYPHIGSVLPAVGYHPRQLAALAETINAADVDYVVSGTPCDLAQLIDINKPVLRARYEYADIDQALEIIVEEFIASLDGE